MNIQSGLEIVKQFEGFRASAYKDSGGLLTIGYGTTNRADVAKGKLTKIEAEACLRRDMQIAVDAIWRYCKVPLNQNQFSALVSLVYNIGVKAFRISTLLKLLNTRDYSGAAKQFAAWRNDNGRRVQGLVNRRALEQKLFQTPC